jgi:hypothetical protein
VKFPFGLSSLTVAALLAAGHGLAATAVELHWTAPEECPKSEDIGRGIERLVGAGNAQTLVANVRVRKTPRNRWQVSIDLNGAAIGHRELVADSCAQASRAAALIIALAANPGAELDLASEEPEAEPKPPPEEPKSPPIPTPAPSTRPQSPPVVVAAPKPQIGVFAGIGYTSGLLPSGAGELEMGGYLRGAQLSIVANVDVTDKSAAKFGWSTPGADFQSIGGQLLGCVAPFDMRVRAAACAGPRLELLLANGFGAAQNLTQSILIPTGVVAGDFAVPVLNPLELGVITEMLVFARQPEFIVENLDAPKVLLHKPSILGLRVAIRVAWRM